MNARAMSVKTERVPLIPDLKPLYKYAFFQSRVYGANGANGANAVEHVIMVKASQSKGSSRLTL